MRDHESSWRVRIGLSGSIGPDDGGEVGVAEEELVVALVGLEVWALLVRNLLSGAI